MTKRIWPALLAIAMLVPAAPAQARPKQAGQQADRQSQGAPASARERERALPPAGVRREDQDARQAQAERAVPRGSGHADGARRARARLVRRPARPGRLARAHADTHPADLERRARDGPRDAAGDRQPARRHPGALHRRPRRGHHRRRGRHARRHRRRRHRVQAHDPGRRARQRRRPLDHQPDGLQLLTPARSSSPRRAPRRPPTSSRSSPYQGEFLDPFSNWIYKGEEFPWATAFEPTIEEGLQSYDGQLQLLLTHDPTP